MNLGYEPSNFVQRKTKNEIDFGMRVRQNRLCKEFLQFP